MTTVAERAIVAAGRSIAERGLSATTLEEVARLAGVSRATLYRHFPNGRHQLLDEVVVHEVGRFFADLYEAVGGLSSLDEVLEVGLVHAHRTLEHHSLLHRVLREDPGVLDPGLGVAMEVIHTQVAEVLRPFVDDGALSDERSDVLARVALDYISTQGRWNLESPAEVEELVRDELLAWRGTRPRRMSPARPRPMRPVSDDSPRGRLIDAAIDEVAAGRLATFTLDGLARSAGVSRATLYRHFPGGREGLLAAAVDREGSRLFAAVADAMAAEGGLQECLLAGLTTIWRHLARHRALVTLCATDAEPLRRALRFDAATRTYYVASSFAQPLLGRWLDAERAGRLAEWICRIVVSFWLIPADYLRIDDPASVATFYSRHLAAGVEAMAGR